MTLDIIYKKYLRHFNPIEIETLIYVLKIWLSLNTEIVIK